MNRAANLLSFFVLLFALTPAKGTDKPTTSPATPPTTSRAVDPNRTQPGPYKPIPLNLLKVEEGFITVKPRFLFANELQPATEQTYSVDPKLTKVFAQVVTAERENEKGQIVREVKMKLASIKDLKEGQVVYVASNDDAVAVDIIIQPPLPTRRSLKPATRDSEKPADKKRDNAK